MNEIFKLADDVKTGLREARKEAFLEVAEEHAEEGIFVIEEHNLPSWDSYSFADIGIDEHRVMEALRVVSPRYNEELTREVIWRRSDELAPQLASKIDTHIESDAWSGPDDFARTVVSVLIEGANPNTQGYDCEANRTVHASALLDAVLAVIAKNAAEIIKAENDAANRFLEDDHREKTAGCDSTPYHLLNG